MRSIKMAAVVLFALGCGGEASDMTPAFDRENEPYAPEDAVIEIGQAQEAQSVPSSWVDGFGVISPNPVPPDPTYGAAIPCTTLGTAATYWTFGGTCYLPSSKTVHVHWDNSHGDYVVGAGVLLSDMYIGACNIIAAKLNLNGWDIQCNTSGGSGMQVSATLCVTGCDPNPSELAYTFPTALGSTFTLLGRNGRYVTGSRTVINLTQFSNKIAGHPDANREEFAKNTSWHEMSHAIGLAHWKDATNDMFRNALDNEFSSDAFYNSLQLGNFQGYQPGF